MRVRLLPGPEAIRTAGRHTGRGSEILVHVDHTDGTLRFRVSDGGPGLDAGAAGAGHGSVTVPARLGAVGGALETTSGAGGTPIAGTTRLVGP